MIRLSSFHKSYRVQYSNICICCSTKISSAFNEHCFHDYETKNDSDRYLMECGPEATSAIEHYRDESRYN